MDNTSAFKPRKVWVLRNKSGAYFLSLCAFFVILDSWLHWRLHSMHRFGTTSPTSSFSLSWRKLDIWRFLRVCWVHRVRQDMGEMVWGPGFIVFKTIQVLRRSVIVSGSHFGLPPSKKRRKSLIEKGHLRDLPYFFSCVGSLIEKKKSTLRLMNLPFYPKK